MGKKNKENIPALFASLKGGSVGNWHSTLYFPTSHSSNVLAFCTSKVNHEWSKKSAIVMWEKANAHSGAALGSKQARAASWSPILSATQKLCVSESPLRKKRGSTNLLAQQSESWVDWSRSVWANPLRWYRNQTKGEQTLLFEDTMSRPFSLWYAEQLK